MGEKHDEKLLKSAKKYVAMAEKVTEFEKVKARALKAEGFVVKKGKADKAKSNKAKADRATADKKKASAESSTPARLALAVSILQRFARRESVPTASMTASRGLECLHGRVQPDAQLKALAVSFLQRSHDGSRC